MCGQCDQIDIKIKRLEVIARRILDQQTLDGIAGDRRIGRASPEMTVLSMQAPPREPSTARTLGSSGRVTS